MHVDIFIRTYKKDLPWLAHALRSIHRYVSGYRNIIVTIPSGQGRYLGHLTAETVIEVKDLPNGYIGQQLTKMQAWKYTSADWILYWDSDCVAGEPLDVTEEFFTTDGRGILWAAKWEDVGDAQCWKGCTDAALGIDAPLEYMRRLPMIHHRAAVKSACEAVEAVTGRKLGRYLADADRFSEFNVIGAHAHRSHARRYDVRTTMPPPNKVRQFWSWGGITEEVQAELDRL